MYFLKNNVIKILTLIKVSSLIISILIKNKNILTFELNLAILIVLINLITLNILMNK
jgi:hypothetical protein